MKKGKIGLMLGLAVLLIALSGCAPSGEDVLSEQESQLSGSTISESEPPSLTAEESALLSELASVYELKDGGKTLEEGEELDSPELLGFGVLRMYRLDEQFRDSEGGWHIPKRVLGEACGLFFQGDQPGLDSDASVHFSTYLDEQTLPFTLQEESAVSPEPGIWEVTYQRQSDRGILTPVTYRFVCCELEEVPPLFEETFQPGDTLFQLVSVTQRTDLLPEQESQVIEISTAEELLAAAKRINESGYLQQNDTYLLTADIDLTGVEWTPIGFNERVLTFQDEDDPERDPSRQGFNGVFDGQGHTITGLTITEEQGAAFIEIRSKNFPKETMSGMGLFALIGQNGTVRDLRLENAQVLGGSASGSRYVGLLAGTCYGTVERVSVQGTVSGNSYTGGMIGQLMSLGSEAVVRDCTAEVEVECNRYVGGLIGISSGGITADCQVSGSVHAVPDGEVIPSDIGGLVGRCSSGNFVRCHAQAEVFTHVEAWYVGGFCGMASGGCILDCTVDGSLTAAWEPVNDYYNLVPEEPEVEILG